MSNGSKNSENNAQNERETTVYELAYLLQPLVPEEELAAEMTKVKDVLSKRDIVFVSEGWPEMRTLAYAMKYENEKGKRELDSAYFGWIKFEVEGSAVPEISQELKENENVVRHMIIKTEKEETLSTESGRRKQSFKKKEKEEVSEEHLDKAIEELVAE